MRNWRALVIVVAGVTGFTAELVPVNAQRKPALRGSAATLAKDETAVANAKADLDRVTKDLAQATAEKRQEFERSPELTDAQKAVSEATKAVADARENVKTKLSADAAYTDLLAREAKAQARVDTLRQAKAPPEQLANATSDVMKIGGEASAIARKAEQADTTLVEAAKKLTELNRKLTALKEKGAVDLASDRDLKALKKKQDDAALALTKARNKLDADSKPK